MTQHNLSVRLALEGGQRVKRVLQDVGTTGQRALARITEATRRASRALVAVDAASREVQASLGRFAAQLGPVGRGLAALGPAGLAAGAAIGGIAGETFKDTLRLAQNLATAWGRGLRPEVEFLDRVLEDPIRGMQLLERRDMALDASQRALIRTLERAGDRFGAQVVILSRVERPVGGTGETERQGLRGATDRLQKSRAKLLEELGRTPAISGTAGALFSTRSPATWTRSWASLTSTPPMPARP